MRAPPEKLRSRGRLFLVFLVGLSSYGARWSQHIGYGRKPATGGGGKQTSPELWRASPEFRSLASVWWSGCVYSPTGRRIGRTITPLKAESHVLSRSRSRGTSAWPLVTKRALSRSIQLKISSILVVVATDPDVYSSPSKKLPHAAPAGVSGVQSACQRCSSKVFFKRRVRDPKFSNPEFARVPVHTRSHLVAHEYSLPGAIPDPLDPSCARSGSQWRGAICRTAPRNPVPALRHRPGSPPPARVGRFSAGTLRSFQSNLPAVSYGAGIYREVWPQPGRL